MDEHDRAAHRAALFERVAEEEVVVVFQTHAAEDDDVDLRLHGDAGEQLVVGLAGDGEDGQLLALDERVEHVDHRDAGADHALGHDALGGVDGGTADGDHIFGQRGAVVARHARAVEHAPEQVVGKRDHHGPPEEAHGVGRADALRAGKDLQGDEVAAELDDARVALADEGKVAAAHARGAHGHDVADDGFDLGINLLHSETLLNPLPCSGRGP